MFIYILELLIFGALVLIVMNTIYPLLFKTKPMWWMFKGTKKHHELIEKQFSAEQEKENAEIESNIKHIKSKIGKRGKK